MVLPWKGVHIVCCYYTDCNSYVHMGGTPFRLLIHNQCKYITTIHAQPPAWYVMPYTHVIGVGRRRTTSRGHTMSIRYTYTLK